MKWVTWPGPDGVLRLALGLALGLAAGGGLRAATTVSGTVYNGSGGPWTTAGSPYVVSGDVTVPAGQTLTIDPGVVVKFRYGTNDLIVNGTLTADGSPAARILFTSERDDTAGGDTDGAGGAPYAGIWGCLRFTATSTGSLLDNVEVRYPGWDSNGGIWVQGGQLTLTNSLVTTAGGNGLRIENSNPVLTGNTYTNNTWAAVAMNLNSNPDIHGVTASGNGTNGLVLDAGTLAAGGLAWDDPDIVYVFYGDVTLPAGSTLTIAAGQVVKVGYGNVDLLVNGTLIAPGTAGAPIEFTSDRDDTVGGGTDNRSDAPYRGVWGGLKFGATSSGNSLQYCRLSYGGWDSAGQVLIDHAGVAMDHCTLRQCAQNGLRIITASPTLSDTTFADHNGSAVSMDLGSNPDIDRVTVSNCGTNGLTLDSGALPGNGFWDDPDITYRLWGDVTVPAGSTLTVAPGQVVKAAYGSQELRVEGTLLAGGTAAAPIVFTTEYDDTVGGDTNNNSTNNGPYAGLWDGLRFEATSTGSTLDYVAVRYGGWSNPGNIWVNGGQLRLANSTLYRGSRDGLRIVGSSPTLLDNRFEGNGWSAVSMDLASNPDIQGVTVVNNGVNGLTLDSGALPGDGFWDDPDITYRMSGDVTVPPGLILTIAPGQVVKVAYGSLDLFVQGTLLASGTAEAPIVFTSENDDSVGGDTNNNGGNNGPNGGIWGRLRFEATSTGSLLSHVGIYYSGWGATGAIEVVGGELTMTDGTVYGCSVYGARLEQCAAAITGTLFDHNAWAAISTDLSSTPAIASVTLDGNGQNGLRLDSGTLPGDAIWDDTDIVHILPEDVVVPPGATLTLAPGLVVKAEYGAVFLVVDGTLSAEGTVEAPIVFTSDRDDSAGGDTNNRTDGPYRGVWGGLVLTANSLDSVLDHVEVRYGGGGTDALVLVDGSSVQIRNSLVTQSGTSGIGGRNSAGLDLENAVVSENSNTGIFAVSGSVATLFNCTVDHNTTGVHTNAATAVITNSLVTRNTSAGIFREGTSSITVGYCDVHNPGASSGNYRNLASQTGQNGNLSADPLYAGKGALAYRLQDGSPAIDAGTSQQAPVRDFLGLLRYDDPGVPNAETGLRGGVDMGAFEHNGLEPLDLDLSTRNVAGPTAGTQNGTLHVTWEVANTGTADAEGTWYDVVYLSADGTLSDDDRLIGTLEHTGGLGAGDSYNAALDILLQGVVPGSFHFLVVADARQETREGGTQANNAAVSAGMASFTMPVLTLGVPTAGTCATVGDRQFYQVLVPTGSNLLLRLDDVDNAGLNELYLSRGTPPSSASAQYSATGGADQAIAVPAAAAGVWYIQVHNAFGTGAYTLLAQVTQLGLYSASPGTLGNGADMVLTLTGAGFATGTSASLVSGGGSAYPGTVIVDSFSRLTVTFPAASVPPGTYTLRVAIPAGEQAELANAVTVTAGGEAKLETKLVLPARLGYHQLATLYVDYGNTGTVAMQAPLLNLTASQNGRAAALMTLDMLRVSDGFWTTAVPEGFSHSVQFLASGATPGVLQPGESGRVAVYWAGWLQPWDFSYPPISFRIGITNVGNTVPVGDGEGDGRNGMAWDGYRESMRPDGLPDDAWNALWTVYVSRVGTTWGEYVAMLDRNALYLGGLGYRVTDVKELLAFELLQADGLNSRGSVTSAAEAVVEAPVLPLLFGRSFPNSITGRYRLGAFGRGWAHPWEVSLAVATDGTVRIRRPHQGDRVFQPDARGGYSAAPGDYGRLTALGGGAYSLTEKDGMRTAFGTSGLVDYLAEPNGNRISCAYGSGLLTRLAHSSGQALSLAYNPAGRVASVTDPQGRQTTFAYDAGNEHLLTVTRHDGRVVSYSYAAGSGTPSAHALTSITYPDGSHRYYSYDDDGRCTGTRRDGDAEAVVLSYPSTGAVQATHARGQVSTFFFDHRGYLAKGTDALGQALYLVVNDRGHLTRVADTEGRALEMSYDSRGNMVRLQDPMAQSYSFTYATPMNLVATASDAAGRTSNYTYDLSGNLLSIALDGVSEHFAHDGLGELTNWTNRRGQLVGLVHDSNGRLTRRDYPDIPDATYAYDTHGNLTSVTDVTGTTAMTYDAKGFLSRITYPGNRYLEFTYDAAGRRTSMTDHLGNRLNYAYDVAGRLQTIADGTSNTIVQYTYDPCGRLAREDRGGGTSTTYAYDLAGRITAVSHRRADQSLISETTSTYDGRGLCVSETGADGTWTYDYDALERLVTASFESDNALIADRALTYAYDAVGNRTRVTVNGSETLYTTNGRHQVTRAGTAVYTYDADGNLVRAERPEGTTTYAYDSANRLQSVSGPGGTWSYTYNALGDRVASTVDGVTTTYLIDPLGMGQTVAEFDAAGSLLRRYDYGLGLIRQTSGGDPYYYLFTPGGNTDSLATSAGTTVNHYLYDPFGSLMHETEGVGNPYKYVGVWGVTDEGNGLHCMRTRFYLAEVARFTSTDPLRVPPWGLYTYCSNDGVNHVDPMGLSGRKSRDGSLGGWVRNWRRLHPDIEDIDSGDMDAENRALDRREAGRQGVAENSDQVAGEGIANWFTDLLTAPFWKSLPWRLGSVRTLYKNGRKLHEVGEAAFGDDTSSGGSQSSASTAATTGTTSTNAPAPATPPSEPPSTSTTSTFSNAQVPTPSPDATEGGGTGTSGPGDPNAKLGPAGVGAQAYVLPGQTLPYRVDFENDATASAPAQYVAVRDQLSASFDWSTFELTEVGFGDRVLPVPAGQQSYATIVPMSYLEVDFEVHVQTALDLATGLVSVDLFCIDPETGLPPPVEVGFLPPEDGTGRGKGYFSYVIRPRAGLASGTEIRNVAVITFDFGEVIATNQVDPHDPGQGTDPNKEALVTIDASTPTSSVAALPAQSLPGFQVTWSGTDTGSGIASYTVYVSTDGGPFSAWLSGTALTSATYPGTGGHTYGFYVIAKDAAGHVEAAKAAAEASTTVVYTVTFVAGEHGSLAGATPQQVATGGSTTPVQAVPDLGYHFVHWVSGGAEFSLANPVTVTNVTADRTLTAEFEINVYEVTYGADAHGSIGGTPIQAVPYGGSTTAVTALADPGYHFQRWGDGSTQNPRTDTHVTAALALIAEFEINSYAVTFQAGANGTLTGTTVQTVTHGGSTTPVTAVPNEGFVFQQWSDSSTQNPRTVTHVTATTTLTASFRVANPVAPNGVFEADIGAQAVAQGKGWWDLGGAYALTAAGNPLALNLVHDTKGKLTGAAVCTVGKATAVNLPVKGSVKGTAGTTVVTVSLKGSDPSKTVSVGLTLNLTVAAGTRRLTGTLVGTITNAGVRTPVSESVSVLIPGSMDGTWTLRFVLGNLGTTVTGTAVLTLSNGVDFAYLIKGKRSGTTAVLSLSGDPSDPPAKAIKIKTTITPMENGAATLNTFSAKGYGQNLAW